jgi:hypothetical protein
LLEDKVAQSDRTVTGRQRSWMSVEVEDKTGTKYMEVGSQDSWKSEQPKAKIAEG